MNKKIKIILAIASGMVIIGILFSVLFLVILPRTIEGIYDDEDRIASQSESQIYRNRRESVRNGDYHLSFFFSGIDTLWTFESENNNGAILTVNYESEITEGRFKAVLVSPDDTIDVIFEGTDQGTIQIPLEQGKSRFRIVGEEAEGEINLSITSVDSVEIHKDA
ncbi:hypothetical protein [Amphibacillus jilinensis]|uniref:hypothetical protein n=1 Tax=Amphibacillus jilinensis TaxID=1216008 RepID=UPI0002EDB8C8|nr:hypothetical protein [Amphibacillus jilinensis]